MKGLAWILLIANVLVAGFFLAGDNWPTPMSPQTAPFNVDRLSLRRGEAPLVTPRPSAPPVEALCIEWRGLAADEFSQVREQLKAMAGERIMSFTEIPLATRQWVLFPPLPSAESAAAKANELAAAGVQDVFAVQDGPWRNAISLGLYGNEEAAARRVRELEGKGVLGTRIELLPRQGTDFYFVIRSEDPDTLKDLGAIKQAYPNSQQSRIACPRQELIRN
ncbi:MAG: hypothetical protein ACYC5S_10340 [Thiobacillus sp.]